MTLVLAGAIGGKFHITTADTRRTEGLYWEDLETGEYGANYNLNPTKKVVNKVNKLTNFVTYATAGNSNISRHIIKELKRNVSKNDGVLITGLRLQEIIHKMREEVQNNKDVPFYYKFLDDHDKFGIVLNGFTNEIVKGKSFFCVYISGFSKDVHTDEIKDNEYKYIMWAPNEEYPKRKEQYMSIDFDSDKTKKDAMLNHYLKLHSTISLLEPKSVSELCDYDILEWNNFTLNASRTKKQVNVSRFYEMLL